MIRRTSLVLLLALLAAGCGADDSASAGGAGTGGSGGTSGAGGSAGIDPGNATFEARGSVEQVHVWKAEPATALTLEDATGTIVQSGVTDHLGSLIYRKVRPADGYVVRTKDASPEQHSGPIRVMSVANSLPPSSFYAAQKIIAGNGYVTTRDGTTLAIFVTLPGPIDQGPYPTMVNYSGYDPARPGAPLPGASAFCAGFPVLCDAPADPSAEISALMGYATVGVNMRGTGCSGGAYDFFETLQVLDGYDTIEAVAAQPWVLHNKVGMTGLSYPGISQMFVARAQPPSLAAITPLSVIGNTATTLLPGGILNSGFAIEWGTGVLDKAAPYGQGWEQGRVDGGDSVCEENQLLHDQRVDIIEEARNTPYYDAALIDPINPTLFVDQITVPVFLASAFQDEQTGPFFTTLLDRFVHSSHPHFTVYNGVHVDGFAPQVLVEWKTFLDFYVARQLPKIDQSVRLIAGALFQNIFGANLPLPPDRFTGYATYEEALAAYEAELPLRAIFEDGGDPAYPGAPVGTFEKTFASWPPAGTTPKRLYFQPDGSLADTAPTAASAASQFELDPAAGQRGILAPGGNVWDPLPAYDWRAPPQSKAVTFVSAPLTESLLMLGNGSVDLWIQSNVNDADLEVNLTEVRPDGKEMYVQSGWLRASHRKLGADSTELWPSPTHLEVDAAPLPTGQWEPVRIAIAGFGHVFRTGSRIRISVDTPGDSRAAWRFDLLTFPGTAMHKVAHDAAHPSSVVLPVIAGATAPTPLPACPSLRGQPCRNYVPTTNDPAN